MISCNHLTNVWYILVPLSPPPALRTSPEIRDVIRNGLTARFSEPSN